jgi:hypothetical protein
MDPSASVLHNMARARARRAGRLRANNLDAGNARAALCHGERATRQLMLNAVEQRIILGCLQYPEQRTHLLKQLQTHIFFLRN